MNDKPWSPGFIELFTAVNEHYNSTVQAQGRVMLPAQANNGQGDTAVDRKAFATAVNPQMGS